MTDVKKTPAPTAEVAGPSKRRLHVSGLVEDITEDDLRNRFKSFGVVNSVELVRTDTGACRGFGYVEVTGTEKEYTRCLNTLQHTKWKGKTLNIAPAKVSFVNRLKLELEERKAEAAAPPPVVETQAPKSAPTPKEAKTMKGWKTGKMGRVYATVHMVDPRTRKLIKYDPSNANHIKRFRDDADPVPTGRETPKESKVKNMNVKESKEKKLDMNELDIAKKIAESVAAKKDGKTIEEKPETQEKSNGVLEGKDKKPGKRKVKDEEDGTEEDTKETKKGKVGTVPSDLFGGPPPKKPAVSKEGPVSFPTVSIIDEFRSAMAAGPLVPKEAPVQVVPIQEAPPKESFAFGFAAEEDEIEEPPVKPVQHGKSVVKPGIVDMEEPDLPPPKRQRVVVEEDKELDSEPEFEIQKPEVVVADLKEVKTEKMVESDEGSSETTEKEKEKRDSKKKEKAEKQEKKKKENTIVEKFDPTEVETKEGKKETKKKIVPKDSESEPETVKITENEKEKPQKKTKEKQIEAEEKKTPVVPTEVVEKTEKDGASEKEERRKKKEKAAEALKTKEELKALANQKRLESIQQRNALMAQRQALKINPEKPTKKKIVFDDDGNVVPEGADSGAVDKAPARSTANQSSGYEQRENEGEGGSEGEEKSEGEVGGKRKEEASWLGSESEGEEKDADWSIKPVFEGKQGARMLSMQARYKGDERFKLTESFVDSESESGSEDLEGEGGGEDDVEEGNNEEKLKRQLQKEKEAQLQILKGMVPKRERQLIEKKMIESSEDETGRKKAQFVDVNKMHYDPTKADASQFEVDRSVELAKKRALKQAAKEAAEAAVTAAVTPMPEVSSERFVKVNLKTMSTLFKRPGTEPAPEAEGGFSLLGGDDEQPASEGFSLFGALGDDDGDMQDQETEDVDVATESAVEDIIHSQSDKSDGEEGKPMAESSVITAAAPTVAGATIAGRELAAKRLFFFHLSTPELANRLVEKKETDHGPVFEFKPFFVRDGSLEEIEEKWRQERSNLTHQFKTKHKTSVRRLKKLRQVRPKAQ